MNTLLALLTTLTVTLTPRKLTEPGIVKHTAGDYILENPKASPVTLVLDCGPDYEDLAFHLPKTGKPESVMAVRIVQPDGRDAVCIVEGWKFGWK